ncbi:MULTISPECIES: rod shape-determining protein MreC [unclassified Pedobacter]|uniref:rod shape-determining protein MreC n=1 Tax=Pedobacter TaxID=84567 RepID=UPI000B4BD302|nr:MULTISPECIES: rod shape-determining protein MreC [unclassified Pedobacter]MCX2431225.1 rod shape-determining protein MreC [Pedobacter sp. GR22-10]MCX2584655.1 rod shape-determining protein MreC [Pedobacter sp. MR22-3]OWK71637.1 rod shape-determining protein MreC [Pedobacter sp. AJM]
MRNLWIFVSRYNAFFLFIIFFLIGIYLTVKNNAYQRSVTLNSSNEVIGTAYERLNVFKRYLNLGMVNDSLAAENAKLKSELLALHTIDTAKDVKVVDTLTDQQYTYLAAKVVKNSVTLRNNIMTINKGSVDGIKNGMAVIAPQRGVVGLIRDVSEHLATIQSLLHKDTRISVSLKKNHALGSLVWGDGNFDIRKAFIKEVPNHIKMYVGDSVITSGYGSFPAGIFVGKIIKPNVATNDNFLSGELNLVTDFSTLQYVYVIKDKKAEEQKALESLVKPNE